jgi:hypothetical protein
MLDVGCLSFAVGFGTFEVGVELFGRVMREGNGVLPGLSGWTARGVPPG